jgi:predicted DNA-binding transcriptional regulator AlpA
MDKSQEDVVTNKLAELMTALAGDDGPDLDVNGLAKDINSSRSHVYVLVGRGEAPPFYKIGSRGMRFPRAGVRAWKAQRQIAATK